MKDQKIGFVEGKGTTTKMQHYTFTDESLKPGNYHYRLKQIDFDGMFEYSKIIKVEVGIPEEFSLSQNYPNPFNPTTKIKYQIPKLSYVNLIVYDVLGNEVVTLVNEESATGGAGEYEVEWNASELPSGIYFYQLRAGNFIKTKKMMLMK